ncbi:MAG: TIGR03984 family CRISPR-associated protein [Tepidanaerobacter acetatoxydans]|uniref:type III-D CRISPR-associated protein Csx19 n=1 Tax=Tepidanaerobacter acetatoxydans TaxID=499229 RepID=UPI0026EAEDD3|nr:CRISPR-associated protein Csx19 [Tepidanaerobacter acetatoxydans]NLU11096.1 TIGR03984 family CRISPR-associated protein [Tepidanaerobacter acetatoxydans]
MNGLKLANIKSTSKPMELNIASWQDLQKNINENFKEKSYAVVYLDYKVLIGKINEKNLKFYNDEVFDPKFIVKMRVFNEEKELLLWRQDEYKFEGRMRLDNEGDNIQYFVEVDQVLWGNPKSINNEWTVLKEARGTEIYIPYLYKPEYSSSKRLAIRTRNYVGYNEIGQAGYTDCRFVSFCEGGK